MEIRFPDAAGNPYLTFASMLMAGIDGIKNKIDPGKAFDKDLYTLGEDEVKNSNSMWFFERSYGKFRQR